MTDLLYACSYTDFDNLAHQPSGTPSKVGLTSYIADADGKLEKCQTDNKIMNPAFARFDQHTETLYFCTESIEENGQIVAYAIDSSGAMIPKSMQNAHGTSTCYLTLDNIGRKLLFVNYWDSSLGSLPMNDQGELHPLEGFIKPAKVASRDRSDHLQNRQLEPHAHSVVLDPFVDQQFKGKIAFVPDLGMDTIKQYRYDHVNGSFLPMNEIPSADGKGPHGPRYLEFHQNLKIAYVVNELSSLVSVFLYDSDAVMECLQSESTECLSLKLIQQISTVPDGYTDYNTCGRIHVHTSGNFVLVSNRGHDSIATYSINPETGLLTTVGIFSTLGRTPRHFQLNEAGDILCAANQDSDSLVMFKFTERGELVDTGLKYQVNSPNFVQFVHLEEEVSADESGNSAE